MPEPVRILCAGDLHLGRCPSGVSADDRSLSVAGVWECLVQRALDEQVEAVVLTGDTVDQENKVFEAMQALESGVRRLAEGGVEVIAVAGNHDYDALPRLLQNAGDLPLRFLGRNGTWETHDLTADGVPRVQLVGWSFRRRHEHTSPVSDFSSDLSSDLPTLGILHCEVDQLDSKYAPVQRAALAQLPVNGWLMGHIHAANEHRENSQLQLYPGSLQPLHRNEPGLHSAWMLDVESDGTVEAERLPLSSLRYATVTVDVADCEHVDDVEAAASDGVREKVEELEDAMPHLERVICCVRLEGRTALGRQIQKRMPEYVEGFATSYAGANASLSGCKMHLRPQHNLEELAEASDAPGTVAQLLLDLENGAERDLAKEALRRARSKLRQVHQASGYETLRSTQDYGEMPTDDAVRDFAKHQSLLLLDQLLDQSTDEIQNA
jgi:DNA repair exonuclease SbcCD nuclease subunit